MDIDTSQRSEYYKRQILIESFGIAAQKKISHRSCLIVGIGGLGCPIGLYLTVSGVGVVGLCDYDEIELSNVGRQILFSPQDIGKKKTHIAQKTLQEKNPFVRITEHAALLNESNAKEIISQYDVVLDCTDNFHSKYLIHDTCVQLQKDLVQGSLFQTQGQVISFAFSRSVFKGCMRCIWKEEPAASCVKSCAQAGILSIVAGTVALRQATTALQFMTENYRNAGMSNLYNYTTQDWMHIPLPHKDTCEHCTRGYKDDIGEPLLIDSIQDDAWCILDVRNEKDHTNFFGKYPSLNVSDREKENLSPC